MVENCGLLLLVNYGLTVVELYGLWFLVDMIVNHVDSMFYIYIYLWFMVDTTITILDAHGCFHERSIGGTGKPSV